MKLQVLSDLHNEFYRTGDGRGWATAGRPAITATEADVVVLAGDIDEGVRGIEWAAEEAERLQKPVLYVPGNHEFYGHDIDELREAMRVAAEGTRVQLLDNASVVLNGVRFLGATLWSDFGNLHRELVSAAWAAMRDYRRIEARGWWADESNHERAREYRLINTEGVYQSQSSRSTFNPLVAYDLHCAALAWLRPALLDEPFAGRTVVITHHAPTYESLRRAGYTDHLKADHWHYYPSNGGELARPAAYASDLDGVLEDVHGQADLWIHGHIHQALDYAHKGLRVVCNPHGYPWRRLDPLLTAFGVWPERLEPAPDEDPFEGDAIGFDAGRVIDLEEGLRPTLQPELAPQFERLNAIIEDLTPLIGYLGHDDPHVVHMAIHYVDDQAEAFNATLRALLDRLANVLDGGYMFDGLDLLHHWRVDALLGKEAKVHDIGKRLGWHRETLAIGDDEFVRTDRDGRPMRYREIGEEMLAEMRAMREGLPGWIEAALARYWQRERS